MKTYITKQFGEVTLIKFWLKTSRGTDISEIMLISREDFLDNIEDLLLGWVESSYPQFYTTDARINYGWDEKVSSDESIVLWSKQYEK